MDASNSQSKASTEEDLCKNEQLKENSRISKKRKAPTDKSNQNTLSPEERWKRKKLRILNMLDDLNVDVKKADTKTALIDMDVLRENFCLMKGELPRSYSVLLDRFHGADVYLRQNYPNDSLLKDINNYLSLSDLRLSFTEDHVASIMFFYGYKETQDGKKEAYILGRLHPRTKADYSQLTLRLPSQKKESALCQVKSFLTSRKNLNALFQSMGDVKEMNKLTPREQQLKDHLYAYVEACYQAYLQRTQQKACQVGRVPGFTMDELGPMPKDILPPPIVINNHSAKEILEIFRKDIVNQQKKQTSTVYVDLSAFK